MDAGLDSQQKHEHKSNFSWKSKDKYISTSCTLLAELIS